ncbi:hypothetical protein J4450_05795 [Candidatus Micrarchaeota archaeon]|nr:hypothetical protein [Candidatus Micrarchaeota archaeon]
MGDELFADEKAPAKKFNQIQFVAILKQLEEHFPAIQPFIDLTTGQIVKGKEKELRAAIEGACTGYKGPQLDGLIKDLKEALASAREGNFAELADVVQDMNFTHKRNHKLHKQLDHAVDHSDHGTKHDHEEEEALVRGSFDDWAEIQRREYNVAMAVTPLRFIAPQTLTILMDFGFSSFNNEPLKLCEVQYQRLTELLAPEELTLLEQLRIVERIKGEAYKRAQDNPEARAALAEVDTIQEAKECCMKFGLLTEFQFNNMLSAERNWVDSVARQAQMQQQMQQVQTASTLALLRNMQDFINEKEKDEWKNRKRRMSDDEKEQAREVEEERKKIAKQQEEFDTKGLHGDKQFQAIFNENLENNLRELARRTNVDMEEIKRLADIVEGQGKGTSVRIVTMQAEIVLATLNAYDTTLTSLPPSVYQKYHNA